MGGELGKSAEVSGKGPNSLTPRLTNIVKVAVRVIAGSDKRQVSRAAQVLGVSEPTVYRWLRAGNLRQARGAEVLRVHELTGLPLEMLLRG